MEPIHLASVAGSQLPDLSVCCIKSPACPDKVLPVMCATGLVGVVWTAQSGDLPPLTIYHTLNDLLSQGDSYVNAVEIVRSDDPKLADNKKEMLKQQGVATVARILQVNGFRTTEHLINTTEGMLFAYIHRYPMYCSKEVLDLFIPIDMFFTDRSSREQFQNDILQLRK